MTKLNTRVIFLLAAVLVAIALTVSVGIGVNEPANAAEQADNYWIIAPTIAPWYFGEYNSDDNKIVGQAKYGQATYLIRDARGSVIYNSNSTKNDLGSVPAGWYTLEASVEQTDEYIGISGYETQIFIAESRVAWSAVPNIQSWTEGDTPKDPVGTAVNTDGTPVVFRYKRVGALDNTSVETMPTEAGAYEMIAIANYGRINELRAYVSFDVYPSETLRVNEWTVLPRIENWIEGDTPSTPVATAKAGTVSFLYKDSNGEWLGEEQPKTEGEYILVATAYANDYENLQNEYAFKIEPKRAPEGPKDNAWTVVPNIQGWTEGEVQYSPIGRAEAGTVTFTYKTLADGKESPEPPTEKGEYVLIATAEAEGYNTLTAEVSFRIVPPVTLEEHDNTAWLIALVIVCVIAVLLCSGYIAIVLILQKRGISLFGHKTHRAKEEAHPTAPVNDNTVLGEYNANPVPPQENKHE